MVELGKKTFRNDRLAVFQNSHSLNDLYPISPRRLPLKMHVNVFNRVAKKIKRFYKLVNDQNLISALTSEDQEPTEGARFSVGQIIYARSYLGIRREFQVCAVRSGGFSNVYFVIDKDDMQVYCLKGIRALTKNEKDQNQNLLIEAETWLRMEKHANIVSAHSVLSINEEPHILIEYVDGEDLSSLRKRVKLSLQEALKYSIQLTRAMIHAEKRCTGFVHGDLKPGNCLITNKGELKLTDFGMAFFSTDEDGSSNDNQMSLQNPERRGGTNAYMAPEKFRSGAPITAQTDVYAFGIFLFELLVGKRPFKGPTRSDFREQHCSAAPSLDPLRANKIPESLINLISSCLQKDPSLRPPGFEEIAAILNREYSIVGGESFEPGTAGVSVPDILEWSNSFAYLGNEEQSESGFRRALEINTDDPEIWNQKAHCYILSGKFLIAEECIKHSISLAPVLVSTLFVQALLLSKRGNPDVALEHLHRALKSAPTDYRVLRLIGEINAKLERYTEAISFLKIAFRMDRQNAKLLLNLSDLNFSLGKFRKSRKLARKATKLNPNLPEAWKALGDGDARLDNYLSALSSYKKSVALSGDLNLIRKPYVSACIKIYRSFGRQVSIPLAKMLLKSVGLSSQTQSRYIDEMLTVLKEEDYDPLVLHFIDDFLVNAVHRDGADKIPEISEVLRLTLDNADRYGGSFNSFYPIAKVFYQFDQFDDCLEVCERGLTEYGEDEKSYYFMAACYEVQEKYGLADEYYSKALLFNSKCELNRTGMNRVRAKLNELSKDNSRDE